MEHGMMTSMSCESAIFVRKFMGKGHHFRREIACNSRESHELKAWATWDKQTQYLHMASQGKSVNKLLVELARQYPSSSLGALPRQIT
eukprot:scaffold10698_cov213-Skeletonema_marinoi.AAC.16